MKKPNVEFKVYNTPNGVQDIPAASNAFILPDRKGRVMSVPIQFDVNRPATTGTVFVDANNNGICIATLIGDDFVLTETRTKLAIDGMSPMTIGKSLNIDQGVILSDGRTAVFTVRSIGSIVGNIALFFEVNYKMSL